MADDMINKVKKISIPLYEEKTFGELSDSLKESQWKIENNTVVLKGVFL